MQDQVKKGAISVKYCNTEDMTADMLTKGFYGEQFPKLRQVARVQELDKHITNIISEKEC